MSQKSVNGSYWQTPPGARNRILLIPISLEERIPSDHPVRLLDEILDGLDWTAWESLYSGKLGQPPIHPSILCKVLLFAMIRRVRSSRTIEYQIEHLVDFMWLVSGRTIDHSTISDFRRKYKKELKDIHWQMLRVAINMGVAKLSELCIDGTREKMNEVLDQLQQMDRRRKADGIDPKKNPAQLPKSELDGRILPNKEGGYAPNFTPLSANEMMSNDCPSIRRQKSSTSRRLCTTLMPIAFTVWLAKRCLVEARRLVKQRLARCCM